MANTSARMLRLLSLLQTHRYWPGIELADRLEVSERTLRRDIDRLRDLGYPVDASRGVAGGYQLRSGTAMPPLLLDDEEAVAIAVGLRTASTNGAGSGLGGIEETSLRALTKVVQVMPPRLRKRVDALRAFTVPAGFGDAPAIDAGVLTVLAQACRDDERVRFHYVKHGGEESSRLVEPHRLVSLGRRWYLVAWDAERHDWRTFRVDRLSEPRATGARFRQRELPGGDPAEFVLRQVRNVQHHHDVVVDVKAPANEVEKVMARWATVEDLGDGSCRMTMNVDSLDWPALALAALEADFEVVQPPELRAYLRATGERFVRNAGATSTTSTRSTTS